MLSRNGTWLRLSESGEVSDPVIIYPGRIIRLGNEKYYTCFQ